MQLFYWGKNFGTICKENTNTISFLKSVSMEPVKSPLSSASIEFVACYFLLVPFFIFVPNVPISVFQQGGNLNGVCIGLVRLNAHRGIKIKRPLTRDLSIVERLFLGLMSRKYNNYFIPPNFCGCFCGLSLPVSAGAGFPCFWGGKVGQSANRQVTLYSDGGSRTDSADSLSALGLLFRPLYSKSVIRKIRFPFAQKILFLR